MDVDVTDEEPNPTLHRRDVTFRVVHDDATPSRLSVRDSLAASLNKNAAEVVIRELNTKYGMRRTEGRAKVYDSPDDAREIEQDHVLERNKIADDAEADAEAEAEADAGEA
jgi:small subunit ribosomal protein S24e